MKKRNRLFISVGLTCLLVALGGGTSSAACRPCQDLFPLAGIEAASSGDSAACFYSPDGNYCLLVVRGASERGPAALLDSAGTVLWKKDWFPIPGNYQAAVSNRGDAAIISQRLYTSIADGLTVSRETKGPATIVAELYDQHGDNIRTWESNPYSHRAEVLKYVRCVAFHPSQDLLVICIKAPATLYDWGSHVYGVTIRKPQQWRVDLGRDLDPAALSFLGEDIVVRCHAGDALPDSVLVISSQGDLASP